MKTQTPKDQWEEQQVLKTVASRVGEIFDESGLSRDWIKCSKKGERIIIEVRKVKGHPKPKWLYNYGLFKFKDKAEKAMAVFLATHDYKIPKKCISLIDDKEVRVHTIYATRFKFCISQARKMYAEGKIKVSK